jgi:hypothetical protein
MIRPDTPVRRARRAPSTFADRRERTVARLIRAEISRELAETWVHNWDVTTRGLVDFRGADDFWDLGFQYAVEEYRRGYRPSPVDERRAIGGTDPRPSVGAPGRIRRGDQG